VTAATETLTHSQAARRGRVIEAAFKLAGEGGYDAVQMRDVASTASVALGTIYRYFSSKDHLLAACQVEWSKDVQRRLAQRPPAGRTPAERVVDVVRRATRSMERRPSLAAALITAISSPDPAVSEFQHETTVVMGEVLSTAMDGVDAELRDTVVRILSHVWFSTLLGWVNGWYPVSQVGDDLEDAARLLLQNA
jgi:TetR/AcrR family transcriptional regulator, cholesterol catabolism regulator